MQIIDKVIKKENDFNKSVKEYKIDKETAERDFERFCEDWDIDTDVDDLDSEDKEDFKRLKKKIIKKIRQGNLVYNDDETFSYTLIKPIPNTPDGNILTISRTKGQALLAMDNYKDRQTIHKSNVILAAMIKMPVAFISKMDGIDLKILQSIQTLFLVS